MSDHPQPLSTADAQGLAERVARHLYARDPATQMMGMKVAKVGPGHAELIMTVRADMLNGHATCHGGFIFTLADSAFASTAYADNALCGDFGISYFLTALAGSARARRLKLD